MKYTNNIIEGIFINRINRFVAEVEIDGQIQQVHVKNTGRCREILIKGTKIYLEESTNPNRKTKYSLISAYKKDMLINIDSQIPNEVVFHALQENKIKGFEDLSFIKKEKTYKRSRFDIYYERKNGKKGFMEIKGVTLENEGFALFPDAPTERGSKHIYELIDAAKEGYETNVFFLIQIEGINRFKPNAEMDLKFSEGLKKAYLEGVNIIVYDSVIKKNEIVINQKGEALLYEA